MPVWVNLIKNGGRDERLQMSALIRGVKTAICELGRLLKWVESACRASVVFFFLICVSLTSKHLLPAASVDPLPLMHPLKLNAMFDSPSPRWQRVRQTARKYLKLILRRCGFAFPR